MAKARLERTVLTSFLDRLIDHDPKAASDRPMSHAESVHRLRVSVLRDLEWLLNTRRSVDPDIPIGPEVDSSIYTYGLPDISSVGNDIEAHRAMVRNVEETIARFEPRLSHVRARLKEVEGVTAQEVRVVIEATLEMDPNPERIAFDTVIDTSTGRFQLEDAEDA